MTHTFLIPIAKYMENLRVGVGASEYAIFHISRRLLGPVWTAIQYDYVDVQCSICIAPVAVRNSLVKNRIPWFRNHFVVFLA